MKIRFLVAGAVWVAGGVGLMGCGSDSDDGRSSGNDGSGAEGAAGPGQGGAGPGQGGAGPGQGGAGPGQGGAGPGQGGAGPGQGGAGQGGAGQGGAGQGGGPAGCDDGGTRYADCDACQNAEITTAGGCCEAPYDTCLGSPDCVAFAVCAQACENDACVQECANAYPNGVNLYLDVIDCMFGAQTPQDPGACGLVCVDDASCTDGGTDHASCDDCQNAELSAGGCCEAEATTCAGNADCVAINTCLQPCADDACVDACFNANPNGVADFTALVECTFGDGATPGACGTVCVSAASCDDGGPEFATCDDCQTTETDIGGCCEAVASTCFANVACTDLLTCFDGCGPNMACQDQCQVTYAAGLNDLIAVSDCLFGDGSVGAVGSCGVACP